MSRPFLPGRLLLQLRPGLELESIPAHRDVRQGLAQASGSLDGGRVEQTVRRRGGQLRAARAFVARRALLEPGLRHLRWEPIEHELGLSRTLRVEVERGADVRALCADLASLEAVQMASPQYLVRAPLAVREPDDLGPELDASRAMVGAAAALEMEPGDPTLIFGMVDSGAAELHPELAGRMRPGLNTVSSADLASAARLLSQPHARTDESDDEGHGTAVASIAGARGLGVPRGLAGDSPLLAVRALCGATLPGDDHPTAIGNLADIDSALKSCADLGARVLNLSFGTPEAQLESGDPVPHVAVIRYALARECVLVCAAGNSGIDERYFPAALPGVIAVGSVSAERRRSPFSTGGPHVALCAPGERVRVAALVGYAHLSGTSFAAPMVSAAAALMVSRAARQSTALSAAAVRDLLRRSAAPFAPGDSRTTHATCGAGILDVPAALAAVDEECRAEVA